MSVELRTHTAYSFGDGAVTPEDLVARADELGYTSLGITDTADLGGIVRFGAACEKHGVAPIIGAELIVDGRPLALLARSQEGYQHLAALVTRSRSGALATAADQHRRGRPHLTWNDVAERATGLHLLTGSASGTLAMLVQQDRRIEATRLLEQYQELFGAHVAVEVQWHQTGSDEAALAAALIALAERAGVRWMVAQDCRYISRGGRLVHDMLTALRQKLTLAEMTARGLGHPNGNWILQSPERMRELWRDRDAGLEASAAIADECSGFSMDWVRPPLPVFRVAPGYDDDSYLEHCTLAGAHVRWGSTLTDKQRAQLGHELQVIRQLGFAGFFLVMWDAVQEARRRNILCQGRGSSANSAVAFCLNITAIDPVENGLLFERFLSEARRNGQTEAPDIDVDFEHDRREEILNYMYAKYERQGSAITGVTQVYSAPTALQDGMRALGYPAELAFKLSKRLHRRNSGSGARTLVEEIAPKFRFDTTTPRARALLAIMRACEDLPRLRSTHPGGFVLSSSPLGDYAPVEWTTMGRSIIQFDKDDLDIVGIPKFDFLGLGGLSVVRRAFDAVERCTGERPEMYSIDTKDKKTFDLISSGETIGMFQIESRAQITSIVQTKPEKLYDITVQVALIRPGPIQGKFVKPYTDRRRGREEIRYVDDMLAEKLKPILARTQGIPIFQEQAMAIAMALAGYDATQADALRRTMGNHRKEAKLTIALAELRERLIENNKHLDPLRMTKAALQIESDLRGFANYGFPESHAWSFALIAYATGWLKANHPVAFYFGLLNAQPMGFYSVGTLLQDALRHGVALRAPCLRDGNRDCTIERAGDGVWALRVGWRFARGIGDTQLATLEAAQQVRPFEGIGDVVQRGKLDRTAVVALARADAFSAWEPDRRLAAWKGLRATGDTLPLAPAQDADFIPRPLSRQHRILLDYFANGFCIDGHPMEGLRARLRTLGVEDSVSIRTRKHRDTVVVAGMIIARQRPETAKGTVFLLLEDEFGHTNVIVPVTVTGRDRDEMLSAVVILVSGRVERRTDDAVLQVIGARFETLEMAGMSYRSRDFR